MTESSVNSQVIERVAKEWRNRLNVFHAEHLVGELKALLLGKSDTRTIEEHTIIRALREFLENEENESLILRGKAFYRARLVKPPFRSDNHNFIVNSPDYDSNHTIISGYDSVNSKEPTIGYSSAGRANMKSTSYLYVAEDEYTACSEIKAPQRSLISVARFQALRDLRTINMFNWDRAKGVFEDGSVKITYSTLMGLIEYAFSIPVFDESEYYFTQYISDLIRKYGFDGIVYQSFYSNKQNYVFFNCAPSIIGFMDSELIVHYSQSSCYFRINDMTDITIERLEPTIETKKRMKQSLIGEFVTTELHHMKISEEQKEHLSTLLEETK